MKTKAPEWHPACESGGDIPRETVEFCAELGVRDPRAERGEVVVFCLKRRKRAWPGFCISLGFMMEQQGCPARQGP